MQIVQYLPRTLVTADRALADLLEIFQQLMRFMKMANTTAFDSPVVAGH